MKTVMSLFLSTLLITGCQAQPDISNASLSDTAAQPKVSWKVNKEYDKDGNIIRYDSTYSWSYAQRSSSSNLLPGDSTLASFWKRIDANLHAAFDREGMGGLSDPGDFTHIFMNDVFNNKFSGGLSDPREIIRSMDSLRSRMFIRPLSPNEERRKRQL